MKYKNLLNDIYTNFKNTNEYKFDNTIKFVKENNTNIVKFELNKHNLKNLLGAIVEQNHLIYIYFRVKDNDNDYIFFSKTHIVLGNRAIIYNCLLNNGNLESEETIGRDFKNREDIFKFNVDDIIIDENLFDQEFENTIKDFMQSDSKKYIKKT